ncbi:MAG: tRNA (adenosine(37)-N6)-dimethylallyltransferase MiaA [Candidatus Paceibacterota bacterium]|jgi:tRNA dimethylallyltransferase
MQPKTSHILVIVGPTASGKSTLAVSLAKRFHGEVISADSRQVYKGMNLGSGKITKEEMKGIPHHLLDVADPRRTFTASHYARLGRAAIHTILRNKKLPIICGGTGFYIRALVDGLVIPEVKPNIKLRRILEKKSVTELFNLLKKKDPERAAIIDSKNPRRLIRALEIIDTLGKVPKLKKNPLPYPTLFIGIAKDKEQLKRLVRTRLEKRINMGMLTEIKRLHTKGVSWKKLESFGLEYRYSALFLQKKIDKETFMRELTNQILDYAKRQMIWFRPDPRIHWISKPSEAMRLVKDFL